MNDVVRALQEAMDRDGYVAEPSIATAVYLAREMRKPLLVEGDAGVGKTELAKVIARLLNTELIRLQCYEGRADLGPARRDRRARSARSQDAGGSHFQPRIPARAPVASRNHSPRRTGGAADRRDRSRR